MLVKIDVILTLLCTGPSNKPLIPFCHSWLMLDPVQLVSGVPYLFSKAYWNPMILYTSCFT